MDLRCRKTGCKYNCDLTCMAKSVSINKKFICETYEEDKYKEKDFSSLIFSDTPPKIADYRHLKDICLRCDAKCLFSKQNRCIANGITINSALTPDTPKCITFMKP